MFRYKAAGTIWALWKLIVVPLTLYVLTISWSALLFILVKEIGLLYPIFVRMLCFIIFNNVLSVSGLLTRLSIPFEMGDIITASLDLEEVTRDEDCG